MLCKIAYNNIAKTFLFLYFMLRYEQKYDNHDQ